MVREKSSQCPLVKKEQLDGKRKVVSVPIGEERAVGW
jgi:hypothetical protein